MADPKLVLLVDDEPALVHVLAPALSSDQIQVIGRLSAEDAFKEIRTTPFAALIVDALPQHIDVIVDFRRRNPQSPIMLFTGGVTAEQEKRAVDAGAIRVLHKPIGATEIRRHLVALIKAAETAPPVRLTKQNVEHVLNLERKLLDALKDANVKVVRQVLSSDYVFSVRQEQLHVSEYLERVRTGRVKLSSIDIKKSAGEVYSGICVVTSVLDIQGSWDGEDISGTYEAVRIYSQRAREWCAVAGQLKLRSKRKVA